MKIMKKSIIVLAVVVFIATCPQIAFTQVGVTVGTEYGFGGIVRIGSYKTTAEFGGGFAPFFFFMNVIGGNDITKLYFPLSGGGKLSFALTDENDPQRIGLKFGASYNSLIGTGFGGGIDYKVSKKDPIYIAAGIMIYPEAKRLIIERINEDDGTHYTESQVEAPTAPLQIVVSVSYIFGK